MNDIEEESVGMQVRSLGKGTPAYQRSSVQDQISEQVKAMESRLADLKSLQGKLDKHPEVAEILNAATALGLR